MRFLKTIAVLIVLTGTLASCAQTPESPTAPLGHGSLTIWMVRAGTKAEKLRITAQKIQAQVQATQVLPTTVQEQTAGSFGQPSSNVGQTAGSYGQTAGSSGRNASDTGQTAGNYGTTAGSFGTAASNHGQTAGSVGSTAGSFGQTSSTYGQSLGGSNLSTPTPPVIPSFRMTVGELSASLKHGFAELEVRYVDVIAEELEDKLAAVEGKPEYPDVIIASALPQGWDESGLAIATLGLPTPLDMPDAALLEPWEMERVDILTRAPHPESARAFVVWMRDPAQDIVFQDKSPLPKAAQQPARIAVGALQNVLGGSGLGTNADAEAAKFKGELARQLALGFVPEDSLAGLEFKIDVTDASANDRLALVTLRVIASGPKAFGVMRSQVVLRKDDGGQWKVLQASPNIRKGVHGTNWSAMETYTLAAKPAKTTKVIGVSLAAPPDGDNRPPRPDLWWDNSGDPGLLAVEWQMQLGEWTDTRMFLVPDRDPRLQTRVKADFAQTPGKYRWRVWAVGEGGAVKLSPWRELNIIR